MFELVLLLFLAILSYSQVSGENCIFRDENSIKFNFTQLPLIEQNYTGGLIRFQLCKSLDTCDNKKNTAACLQIGPEQKSLGYFPNAILKKGEILFNFTGDNCKENINYTLGIQMFCDYDKLKAELHPIDECRFKMNVRTVLACPNSSQKTQIDCIATDSSGDIYDLSPLIKLSDNYKVTSNSTNSTMILNVCHVVIYNAETIDCIYASAACLSDPKMNKNVGDLASPKFNNLNVLQINYADGVICNTSHFQTTIEFTCDLNAINTEPEYAVEYDCHHKLKWRTQFACSKKQLEQHNSCKTNDREPFNQYNLQSLADKNYTLIVDKGYKYILKICGSLSNHSCPGNETLDTGVCRTNNVTSFIGGKANSKLLLSTEGPYLNYTDGTLCNNITKQFTIIKFSCGSKEELKFIEDISCHWVIQFFTPLVCKNKTDSCDGSAKSSSDCFESQQKSSITSTTSSTNSIAVVVIIIFVIIIGLIVVLSKNQRRTKVKNCLDKCCCWCFPKPNIRVQYSRVNTSEETDALLEEATHSHSDSDDDLLII